MEWHQCINDHYSTMLVLVVLIVMVLCSLFFWRRCRCQRNGLYETSDDANVPSTDCILQRKRKIFLSHSGAQKSFVADLNKDLMSCDRYPFFDMERKSIPFGKKVQKCIYDAIAQCDLGVVILSEEFFSRSMWPMLELVAMIRNGQIKIFPVYLSIPFDVVTEAKKRRKWVSIWKKWKCDEKKKGKNEINIEEWKRAFKFLEGIKGMTFEKGSMLEAEFRENLVREICEIVPRATKLDDSHVKGKEHLTKAIKNLIYGELKPEEFKGSFRKVGLYGVGGIGKTTACMVLCNVLSTAYSDKVCHLQLKRDYSEVELLQNLLITLTNLDAKYVRKLNIQQCYAQCMENQTFERVFLALDNVSDESMVLVENILEKGEFKDGSVVLVTARSLEQLKCLRIKKEDCLEMPELQHEEAKALFLSYAHLKETEIDQDLLEQCLKRCYFSKACPEDLGALFSSSDNHFHPLALRVLGAETYHLAHDAEKQKALLVRIDTFNPSRRKEHPVFSILSSSFDSLVDEDQLLFLDVAFFLPNDTLSISDSVVYRRALEWLRMVYGANAEDMELRLKCLERRSLLEIYGETETGTKFCMHDLWREFAKTKIKDNMNNYFTNRRWIRVSNWGGECCNGKVDLTRLSEMGVVKLVKSVPAIRELDVHGLQHLKSLEVIRTQRRFSELKVLGLGTLQRLTYLRCDYVSSYASIAELGQLTNLQVVILEHFRGDKLPDMNKLTNLRILNLQSSYFLQSIRLQNLTNLTHLHLQGCGSLRKVDVSGCRSLTNLRGFLHSYIYMEEVNLSFCPSIKSDVLHLKELKNLRGLDITGCSSMREVDGLSELQKLERLRAEDCQKLDKLPACKLPRLRTLHIEPTKIPAGFEWPGMQYGATFDRSSSVLTPRGIPSGPSPRVKGFWLRRFKSQ